VTGTDGKKNVIEIKNPRGTTQNPMNDDEVAAKFMGLAEPVLGKARSTEAAKILRALDTAKDVGPALDAIAFE
jgi:hypothetical protein